MYDIHVWLLAFQIVGLAIIAMFASYVLMQFINFKGSKKNQEDSVERIREIRLEVEKLTHSIEMFNQSLKNTNTLEAPEIKQLNTAEINNDK